jgi:hypothetical protein
MEDPCIEWWAILKPIFKKQMQDKFGVYVSGQRHLAGNRKHGEHQNKHHAFLHNAKYFLKSLYYNSGTLFARSCRIFGQCNRVSDKISTQLKTSNKCMSF